MKHLALIVAAMLVLGSWGAAVGSDDSEPFVTGEPQSIAERQAIIEYWTPDRMRSAIPRDAYQVVTPGEAEAQAESHGVVPEGNPKVLPGWSGSGPMPEPTDWIDLKHEEVESMVGAMPQAYGTAPTNPLNGPYGPFQRFAMHGKYITWPRSIHGKFFFTLDGSNYVCSATVAGKSIIITAGHCMSSGSGTSLSNALFCPGYTRGSENSFMGCYAGWQAWVVPTRWYNGGDPDYDYACLVMPNTGSVVADKVGIATSGWAGWAVNFIDVPVMTFGYPQASPFNGEEVQQTASVQWYQWDFTAGDQVSNVIGSDLTGGASGGGWFISWHAPGNEMPDTDGSWSTDPAGSGLLGPYYTGLNSHKRCLGSCFTPPTASAGTFWQEITSPPFLDTADAQDFKSMWDHSNCGTHPANL